MNTCGPADHLFCTRSPSLLRRLQANHPTVGHFVPIMHQQPLSQSQRRTVRLSVCLWSSSEPHQASASHLMTLSKTQRKPCLNPKCFWKVETLKQQDYVSGGLWGSSRIQEVNGFIFSDNWGLRKSWPQSVLDQQKPGHKTMFPQTETGFKCVELKMFVLSWITDVMFQRLKFYFSFWEQQVSFKSPDI